MKKIYNQRDELIKYLKGIKRLILNGTTFEKMTTEELENLVNAIKNSDL